MSRVTGQYDDGTPRRYGDYLLTYKGETVNLLEINDDGNYVVSAMDDQGEHGWMDVACLEPYLADFVCHWDDARHCIAANI